METEPTTVPSGWDSAAAHIFLGDYVSVHDGKYTGRVYKTHWHCPESKGWLAGQTLLGDNPKQYDDGRWVSVLVHGGGAIVVPDLPQFIERVEPFDFKHRDADLSFRPDA